MTVDNSVEMEVGTVVRSAPVICFHHSSGGSVAIAQELRGKFIRWKKNACHVKLIVALWIQVRRSLITSSEIRATFASLSLANLNLTSTI